MADQYGLDPFAKGVLLTSAGSGVAAQAGFQPGDIIVGVNGRRTATVADLVASLAYAQGWRVTIQRGEQQITAEF